MKKVLMFGVTNRNGGIENFCLNYTKEINCQDLRIDYVDIYDGGIFYRDKFMQLGSKVINLTNYRKNPIKSYKELKKLIIKEKYDIIHYNMNSSVFLFPLIAGKKLKVSKIIAHSHNAFNDKGILKTIIHWINKHFIKYYANYYFACSDKAAKYFFSNKILESKNFYIINNAIDVEKYEYCNTTRINKRKELKLNNKFVVGHIGRFNKQKNHAFLIQIFKKLQELDRNTILLLVGTGPLKGKIEKMVVNLNLKHKVIFLNNRDDIAELMQCMDILVMPSLYEGLSLVTVEAQAASLPCLLSDSISQQSKILDSTEFFTLKNPPQVWAKKIIEMKNKNNERKSFKNEMIFRGFDIKTESKKILKIYLEDR